MTRGRRLVLGAVLLASVAVGGDANARPTYFATLRTFFGIPTDSRIDACGVCHRLWEGTGGKNAFGTAVEQRLYTGLSLAASLEAVKDLDSDGDGYTNAEELSVYLTLPGYSCDDFELALQAPDDYHTFITPFVATCLPPLDMRLSQAAFTFLTEVGKRDTLPLALINNGATEPVLVESYGFLPGTPGVLGVTGPPAPFTIPVGERTELTLRFEPAATSAFVATLRLGSNDPETPLVDVPVSAFGYVKHLAPEADRLRCRRSIEKQFARYATTHLDAWIDCAVDEATGIACRRGARDRLLARAALRLRERVGGSKDRACAAERLTPTLLDYPERCGGDCGHIRLSNLASLADCLVCRQTAASARAVVALAGAAPPDLPPTTAADARAAKCIRRAGTRFARAAAGTARTLGRCELGGVTAIERPACAAEEEAALAALAAEVDDALAACTSTAGLPSCAFAEEAEPGCLGAAAVAMGVELAGAVYDRAE